MSYNDIVASMAMVGHKQRDAKQQRIAKYQIETVILLCPCSDVIPNPKNGSQFWTTEEIEQHQGPALCDSGHEVKLRKIRQPKLD